MSDAWKVDDKNWESKREIWNLFKLTSEKMINSACANDMLLANVNVIRVISLYLCRTSACLVERGVKRKHEVIDGTRNRFDRHTAFQPRICY